MGCDDDFEESYATAGDARKAGAVDRGWIPAVIPASATNLRERHNVDTNEVAGTFRIPLGEVPELLARLNNVGEGESVRGTRIHPEPWPEILKGELSQPRLQGEGIHLARDTERRVFAVNRNTGEVHYWLISP
jgi:hypothetical protein